MVISLPSPHWALNKYLASKRAICVSIMRRKPSLELCKLHSHLLIFRVYINSLVCVFMCELYLNALLSLLFLDSIVSNTNQLILRERKRERERERERGVWALP